MLNPEQVRAVRYIDGPMLVIAGAGSGKTRVITQKIVHLIETCGYKANQIFAVTFTNKAANEMAARIAPLLPKDKRRGLKVSTFHTLGLKLLKKHAAVCGLKPGFSIFDSEDSSAILKSLLSVNEAQDKAFLSRCQAQISRWKNDLLAPSSSLPGGEPNDAEIYKAYQETLEAYNAVDFDDLIRLPVMILQQHADIREKWQQTVRYLMVDEYQDSNIAQYQLVKLLVGVDARFMVVGDDDQSIYAWRGARPENLEQLQIDYPNLQVVKLEQNYRSTTRILHAANDLIANNPHVYQKALWSEHGAGELIRVLACRDENDEASQVVMDLISHKLRKGTAFGDYAILYRGNHQSRIFEKMLRAQGVNYRISGGESWFSKSEIRDVFAYLKLLCNPHDDASFLRAINAPKRGVGIVSIDALRTYAMTRETSLYHACDELGLTDKLHDAAREALFQFKAKLHHRNQQLAETFSVETLKQLVDDHGYEAYIHEQSETPAKAARRMENVWELFDWIGRLMEKDKGQTLADVINKLILIDVLEQSDEGDKDSVQLLTLHASKGLEYPYVYLVGLEEELLPHRTSIENDDIEEERRLCYVGITRAQKELCITYAKHRRRGGEVTECLPSRFLEELPETELEWFGLGEVNEVKSKAIAKDHLSHLKSMLA